MSAADSYDPVLDLRNQLKKLNDDMDVIGVQIRTKLDQNVFGGEDENEDGLGTEQLTDQFNTKKREFMSLLLRVPGHRHHEDEAYIRTLEEEVVLRDNMVRRLLSELHFVEGTLTDTYQLPGFLTHGHQQAPTPFGGGGSSTTMPRVASAGALLGGGGAKSGTVTTGMAALAPGFRIPPTTVAGGHRGAYTPSPHMSIYGTGLPAGGGPGGLMPTGLSPRGGGGLGGGGGYGLTDAGGSQMPPVAGDAAHQQSQWPPGPWASDGWLYPHQQQQFAMPMARMAALQNPRPPAPMGMGGGRGGGHGLFPLEMTAVGWPSAEQQQGIVNEGGGVGSGQSAGGMMMINPPPPSAINLPASMTSSTGAGGVGRSSASGLGIGQQPQPMQVEQMWKIVGEGMSVDAVDKKRMPTSSRKLPNTGKKRRNITGGI